MHGPIPTKFDTNTGIELGVIDASNQVDALVVAVGHNDYRSLELAQLRQFCRSEQPVLADVKVL